MRFLLIGDLHYHDVDVAVHGLKEARDVFYRTLLDRFMNEAADLHISLGDLTNYGSASELQEVYEILGRKDRRFIHVLGNHDLYGQSRKAVLEQTGQQRYHAIDTEDAMLVFLDTAKDQNFADWGGWLDEEQLQWLALMVASSGTKPLLVFGHHPVYSTTARSDREKSSIHSDIDMWSILHRKQGLGVYFNGHTHVDSIVTQHNWTFVQVSACLDQPAFRCVELTGEELRITAVDISDEGVALHAPLLHQHMKHFTANSEARGDAANRGRIIPLRTAARL